MWFDEKVLLVKTSASTACIVLCSLFHQWHNTCYNEIRKRWIQSVVPGVSYFCDALSRAILHATQPSWYGVANERNRCVSIRPPSWCHDYGIIHECMRISFAVALQWFLKRFGQAGEVIKRGGFSWYSCFIATCFWINLSRRLRTRCVNRWSITMCQITAVFFTAIMMRL